MRVPAPLWFVAAVGLSAIVARVAWRQARPPAYCPAGMTQLAWRCCGQGQHLEASRCRGVPRTCASPQRPSVDGCIAESRRIELAGGVIEGSPIDWDAPKHPPKVSVAAFAIDSHEVTEAAYLACVRAHGCSAAPTRGEPGLPQVDVSATQAEAYCAWRGGALPSAEQFAYATMGDEGRRYPWGNAGAVCRRAAFGLRDGLCAHDADGPQLAGTHPAGATPEGIADLAGNVAEWVLAASGYHVRGGSWRDSSVTSIRSFSFREAARDAGGGDIGFRCVYPRGNGK